MKKNLLSLLGIALSFGAFAQLPVSTSAENKNVVLEEFTGIYCVFCPDGHVRANQIANDNPGDVVLINVHTGGYANPTPNSGDPDFRTPFGSAIAGQTGLSGYPSGTVNRHVFSGSNTAMNRGAWAGGATTILSEASYANVALEGSIDVLTRELVVDVEVHFTGTAPSTMNLNVALMQNNVEGPQTGGTTFNEAAVLPNGNYNHQHMLRHLLTGQWGEVISTTTQGTTYTGQFTYSIPDDINGIPMVLNDLEIAAFVAEGQQEVITGAKGPISFLNMIDNNATLDKITPSSACEATVEPEVEFSNNGGNTITSARFRYHFGGQNVTFYDWTGSVPAFTSETVTLPGLALPTDIGTSLTVSIENVNNVADSDPTDNQLNRSVNFLSGTDFTFEFTQDRWGATSTWSIYEEGNTSNVIASGGPYSTLAPNTTLMHSYPLSIPSEGCYIIEVNDSFGDGINAGHGEGKYELLNSDGGIVVEFDGKFETQDLNPFRVASLTPLNINESSVTSELTVFPNPVTNIANIQFFLDDASNATLTVHNILGEMVYTQANLDQGQNVINFDVANLKAGMYFTTINTESGTTSTKFTVAK